MTTLTHAQLSAEGTALVLPLAYAGIFDFALSEEELRAFSSVPLSPARVRELCQTELDPLVARHDGHICLRDHEGSIMERERQAPIVTAAWKRARRRARFLGWAPFVRGCLVTGSLSHGSFDPDADIDYLVLVAPRRLFTAFAVLGTAQRLTSVQTLCPNYYLAIDRMELPERDYFIAREMLAATPVLGSEACGAFQRENSWAFERFPNARPPCAEGVPTAGGRITRAAEWLLGGRFGDLLERLLSRLLSSRIDAHYASCGVPLDPLVVREAREEFRLRFHARLHRERIIAALGHKLDRLGIAATTALIDGKRP